MGQPVQTQKWFTLITIVICTIVYIFVGSKQARNELPLSGGNIASDSQSDVTAIQQMEQRFRTATNAMINSLKKDYGDRYFNDMFYDKRSDQSWGRTLFKAPAENQGIVTSKDRFRNKMKIKLLEVLQGGKNVTFVWATGGHSSTAGHGNFYDESYTAVLERTVQSVFRSIGIQFTGRNYAMGSTKSAPEAAWCIESIFGADDLDVVVWDYGMTDGNEITMMLLYCYHVGLHRNRPACLAYHLGRGSQPRQDILKALEDRGMTTLYSDEAVLEAVEAAIPDSSAVSDQELSEIPLFVRNYRCGKLIESGDPYCTKEKFNQTMCLTRRFQTGWHPGWKWHALQGNLAAMFLVETIKDVIQEISLLDPAEYGSALLVLQQEEAISYKNFSEASLPAAASLITSDPQDILIDDIYKTPNFCHTARLPAEIRHKGILLEGPVGDLYNFQEGITLPEALRGTNASELMPLVQDDSERQICEVIPNMDHKDFFFVGEIDGWKKLIIPNDSELKAYGRNQNLKGLVAVCFALCFWGKCPPGSLPVSDLNETTAQVEVNGQPVTNFTKVLDCYFLKGNHGHYWPSANDGKRVEIRARVIQPKSFVQIGAFIVW